MIDHATTTRRTRPAGPLPACLMALLLMLGLCPGSAEAQPQAVLRVDRSRPHQQIDGFGVSGAWWSPSVGAWGEEQLDPLLDLLFSDEGAALSIFRYNLGAGGGPEIRDRWRRTEQIPGTPDGVDLSADAAALRILAGARDRGVGRFVVFSNSPPTGLTINGMASGGEGGGENLDPANADAFAAWLIDRAEAIATHYKLDDIAVSPINEPQWDWGRERRHQEGAHYKPDTALAVLRAVAEELEARDSTIKLIGPEAGAWGESTLPYLERILDDPVLPQRLHRLAVHSYHSNNQERRALTRWLDARGRPIPLAMTEWCELRGGYDYTMNSALVMAEVMHRDLAEAGVVEWSYWLGVSPYRYRDGLVHIDRGGEEGFRTTKRLWTIAHYSRFVRPGAVRIDATLDGADGVLVSGYRSAEGAQAAVVLTNPTDTAFTITLPTMPGFTTTAVFVTDEDRDLAPVDIAGGELTLGAMSIATVVFESE